MSIISDNILREFADKEFRDGYVDSRTRNMVSYQLRALRDQRSLSQKQIAELLSSGTQSTVSRAEDPEYGRLSITTLLEFAEAYDVGLVIKFCSHEEFLLETANLSPGNLCVDSYDEKRVNNAVKNVQSKPSKQVFPMVFSGTNNSQIKSLSLRFISSESKSDQALRMVAL